METEYKVKHVKNCYEIYLNIKFVASAETRGEAEKIIEELEEERGR